MTIKIQQSVDGQWFYEIVGRNGKTMAFSETMKRKENCIKAIKSLKKSLSSAKVVSR